jgi:uncharacterized protein YecT (DUF1311 family)
MWWMLLGVVAGSLIGLDCANAQNELVLQTIALVKIADTANNICLNVGQGGGQTDTVLSGAIDTVNNLNIKGSGQLTSQQYQGVLREQLADILKYTQDCKKSIFDTLVVKMLPKVLTDTGLPVSQSVHLIPRTGQEPSINCDRTNEPIENLLCADADLAEWDGLMGQIYQRTLKQLSPDDQRSLRQRQREWLKIRDATCRVSKTGSWNAADLAPAKPCILQMMKQRVAELNN